MSRARDFPARMSSLHEALGFVEARGNELELPRDITLKLVLFAEELFTNSVRHGCARLAAETIRMSVLARRREVELRYEDRGRPFDPFGSFDLAADARESEPGSIGGLGLILVRGLAKRVRYQRLRDRNVIRVWLPLPSGGAAC